MRKVSQYFPQNLPYQHGSRDEVKRTGVLQSALQRRGGNRDNFPYFSIETYVVTPH